MGFFSTTGLVRLAIAVFLGASTWLMVTWQQNPFREDWVASPVTIEPTRLPNGLVEVGKPGTVRVRVRASQDGWSRIKPDDFKAVVDLGRQTAGIHSEDVKIETSRDYQVVDWDPRRVTVRLEPLVQVSVPVQLQISGKLPDGYTLRNQSVAPDHITVTGEQDIAQTVTQATIALNLDGVRGDLTDSMAPSLNDDKGQLVTGLQFTPPAVRVSLEIDHQIGVKTVPVRATTTGQVAPGYWLSSLSVSPQTVTIIGGPAALGQVDALDLPPLDVSGSKADVTRVTKLTAGSGYSLEKDTDVEVKATIQPLRTTQALPIGVVILGIPEGLEARLSPATVEVSMAGLSPALAGLRPGDVSATIDATGLGAGSYSLPVRMNAPASVSLEATRPNQVTLTLSPPPSPTPAVEPSRTPAASPSASGAPAASASPSATPQTSTSPTAGPSR